MGPSRGGLAAELVAAAAGVYLSVRLVERRDFRERQDPMESMKMSPRPAALAPRIAALSLAAAMWLGGLAALGSPAGIPGATEEAKAATLTTFVAGNKIASETWTPPAAAADGGRVIEATIQAGDGPAQTARTVVGKDGSVLFTVRVGGTTALSTTLAGGRAKVSMLGQGEKDVETKATHVLENLVWHQYVFLLGSYDTAKGGEQAFTAFLPTQAVDFGLKLERIGPAVYAVGGTPIETVRWKVVASPGVAMDLWTDESRSPLLVVIPAQQVEAVRDGYRALAEAVKAEAPPREAPSPPPYSRSDAFREIEVTIGGEEWPLPGTLAMPVGESPRPALVLVHGSGPNDRDETLGPNKPFRDLAWGLATRGIAVLRYDKRTRVHAARMAAAAGALTVKEETVDDALAAVALLEKTPGIDPDRIFVLGHSLGGMLVPRIAARGPRVAGWIVMAGTTRPLEEVYLEQVRYLVSLDGEITPAEREKIAEIERQIATLGEPAKLAAASPSDLPLGLPAAYWKDLMGWHPAEAAKPIHRPMLILQGGRDYQVTMADLANWKAALGARDTVTFKVYPRLDHLFMEGDGPSTPADYARPGHVSKEVVEDIATWILAR